MVQRHYLILIFSLPESLVGGIAVGVFIAGLLLGVTCGIAITIIVTRIVTHKGDVSNMKTKFLCFLKYCYSWPN